MYDVIELYRKPARKQPLEQVAALSGVVGEGLVGDAAAHPDSPRHALIVSESNLAALSATARDLRANIVLRGDLRNLPSGAIIQLGSLALRIAFPCEPCGALDRIRPGLRRLADGQRGVLALVEASGTVRVGDRGHVIGRGATYAATWKERVRDVLAASTSPLTYAELARAAGIDTSYCRAFPRVLPTLGVSLANVTGGLRIRSTPRRRTDPR